MPTVLLVRHARSAANATQVLAGRSPGVHLDEVGREQADGLAERLGDLPLAAVVSSPLERCLETIAPAVDRRPELGAPTVDEGLVECDYGEWTNRPLKELARMPLWKVVQAHPSAVTFPGGESMAGMQHRAVAAVRRLDAAVAAASGPDALWVAVSHADVIKSVVADALGMHLDAFQRIVVDPASVTAIRYTETRPFVLRTNDLGSLSALRPPARRGRSSRGSSRASDAVVGGTTGPTTTRRGRSGGSSAGRS